MNRDRWQSVNQIFHSALELDAKDRRAFIAAESRGDIEIQAEVEHLLAADQNAGSYLESGIPLDPFQSSPVEPGYILCDRFRIVRELAEGGMGHVFEAFDCELGVTVAVKVIRPEIATSQEAIRRFRQEVRLAQSITHPNICRTFDIQRDNVTIDGKKTELIFLTMEFLRGETLAERLDRDGPLSLQDAIQVAQQIASALAAAHTLGIVHRDMKPANIMLVQAAEGSGYRSRVVVTDFGLARFYPDLPSKALLSGSHTMTPIGTMAYMAPEQLDGRAVSTATDIYAFGLVLAEMILGKRVFDSGNLFGIFSGRLHGVSPIDDISDRKIPANWRHAIEACLQIDPSARPKNANEVVALLQVVAPPPDRPWRNLLPATWHRQAIIVCTVLAAVALYAGGVRLYRARTNASLTPGTLLYLTPVRNETTNPSFNAMTTPIQAGLSQSTHINLLDEEHVDNILRRMSHHGQTPIDEATSREIAMRAGAARVAFATITESHGHYSLNIDLQQPDNSPARYRNHWTRRFDWTPAEAGGVPGAKEFSTIRDATDWIRRVTGEPLNDIAQMDLPPEDVTTGNWQALEEYSHAEALLAEGRTSDGITVLERATTLDNDFSLAFARLGDMLFSVGRWPDGLVAYRKALSSTGKQRLTRRELDRVRGIYAIDTADYVSAEAQFRDLTAYYPMDWLGWFYRANPLMRMGKTQAAVECLKHALALQPTRTSALWTLAFYLYIAGNDAEAEVWTSQLRKNGALTEAAWAEGEGAFLRGDLARAEEQFRIVEQAGNPRLASDGDILLSHLYAEEGRSRDALVPLESGIQKAEKLGDSASRAQLVTDRSWLECQLGEYRECLEDLQQSLQLDDAPRQVRKAGRIIGRFILSAPPAVAQQMRQLLENNRRTIQASEPTPESTMATLESEGELALSRLQCGRALKALRAESLLDGEAESRDYLGHGLQVCAMHAQSATQARSLRSEAANAFAVGAFAPAVVWFELKYHPPGAYTNELIDWLSVAPSSSPRQPGAQAALRRIRSVYPSGRTRLESTSLPSTPTFTNSR